MTDNITKEDAIIDADRSYRASVRDLTLFAVTLIGLGIAGEYCKVGNSNPDYRPPATEVQSVNLELEKNPSAMYIRD
tara:strand:- start:223 stop:453 length:231 start_codon:yes stop_codon:yes gene_type:complete